MWEHDCGVVPVVDAEERVLAMLTDRDVCMAAFTQGKPLAELPVSIAASKRVFWVHPHDSVETAERLMRKQQIRRLPVVDERGRLVGLLSLNDLARHAGGRDDDLSTREISQTLGAICPRVRRAPAHVAAN